jgi:hypothetical protein
MANVTSKIKKLKISKYQKTRIRSNEDQKIKRRSKESACKHNKMQCAHTQCLRAQKISRLYNLSPITTSNRKKNTKLKKWAPWWAIELHYILKLSCLLLKLGVANSSLLYCVYVHLLLIEAWNWCNSQTWKFWNTQWHKILRSITKLTTLLNT